MIYPNLASLILRLSVGSMMLTHGWGKFNKLISGDLSFADPIGVGEAPTLILAVLAEFISPILLIVGYKTRLATVLPALTMLVAAFVIHADDPWGRQEFPLLYFFGFATIYLLGSGKYSLDWQLKKV
ncbi:putative oxidoreductase [Ekhidna lutea]|uniref:Putative oxidoreductase n=1 Tax=Ekhidna lutea TaxID=447679 RepID=A0A239H2A6_EKHLU|nr:DoxX family protein [Ekhidna lutea]SNS75517.1 putative oxidoreductase [Ekhidna lutea]